MNDKKTPLSITFNDSAVKFSLYPQGDLCITIQGRTYPLDKIQVDILRSILNTMYEEVDEK